MIKKLTILDAHYSGLEAYFPLGAELPVAAPIILIVGPNGSGKTALLRLIASSLESERYFREQAISRSWIESDSPSGALKNSAEEVRSALEVAPGWFYFSSRAEQLIRRLARDSRFDLQSERDIRYFSNYDREYPQIPTFGFNAISSFALQQLKQMKKTLSAETDLNRWQYVKCQTTTPLYLQEFILPHDQDTEHREKVGLERYCHFDPSYNGNQVIDYSQSWLRETIERTKALGLKSPKPHRVQNSPGQALQEQLDKAFSTIDDFFRQGVNPLWEPEEYSVSGKMRKMFSDGEEKRKREKVPPRAQLAVFMDEPTLYLDYRNSYAFMARLQALVKQYSPRLQFFIPTNDALLIEKMTDCRYISLYSRPAEFTDRLDISKFL